MKNIIKYLILCVLLVGIFYLAYVGYNYLKQGYEPKTEVPVQEQTKKLQKATDFTVLDKLGNKVHLKDNIGKPIVVNFWATWCGPCKSEMPAINNLYEKYNNDVIFMMVNLTDGQRDTVDSVNEFISENGYAFPVYYDTEYSAANAYSVNSIPTTLFINKNGEIAYTHMGAANEKALENYIGKLLGGEKQ